MFNPISIILKENNVEYIDEDSSIRDIYNSNVEKMSDAVLDSHDDFIKFQKDLFEKFKTEKTNFEDFTPQIMSKKVDLYSDSIFGVLNLTTTDKAVLKCIKNTHAQIKFIKQFYQKKPILKKNIYSSKGIGFKTIDIPTQEEYIATVKPYKHAWRDYDKLEDDELIQKFDKCYRSKEELLKEMFANIDFYFKPNTNHYASEYVDIYDEMNKSMVSMLENHKKKYGSIHRLLSDIHDKYTKDYSEDISELKLSTKPEKEKKKLLDIATHNYKVLSNSIIFMIDMISIFHRLQLKIVLMSYENYKELIQSIYDDILKDIE